MKLDVDDHMLFRKQANDGDACEGKLSKEVVCRSRRYEIQLSADVDLDAKHNDAREVRTTPLVFSIRVVEARAVVVAA